MIACKIMIVLVTILRFYVKTWWPSRCLIVCSLLSINS